MKSLFVLASLFLFATFTVHAAGVLPAPQIEARAWLLVDTASGQSLAEKDADTRIEPASLTKLMTAYLAFSALKERRLDAAQNLPVSERAWKAEGSRMFLDPRTPARVDDLLRGMIVHSGNDACIVLAEAIGGSEVGFVEQMNRTAKRLGMTGTHFANATGLPDPGHYSTARDLARLATAVIRDFPEHYKLYALKEFSYAGITQPNRNRLLWLDPNVDGVKTGHTDSAGYCLIASATRDRRRLLSVVVGTASDGARAMESQKLLNYGFQSYETLRFYTAGQPVAKLRVYKGRSGEVGMGFAQDFYVTVPRGSAGEVKAKVFSRQPLLAPVELGQVVGTLRLTRGDQILGDYSLQALQDVGVSGLLGRAWDGLLLLFE
jgi:D-alanyl-D-alanine carboxypeptidase (penicillin-binding protein 5/6)